MLQTIFKYKNSIFGVIIVLFISFAMLGFGVDFFRDSSTDENYAIKVNDQSISDFEYNFEKENYVAGLRNRLGDEAFSKFRQYLNIDKQVRERLVNQALLVQFAKSLGFTSGDRAVAMRIMELFPEDTTVNYSNFLRRTGRSPREFEEYLRSALTNEDYQNILSDLIPVTRAEIETRIRKDKESYDVDYVAVDPKSFKNIKVPTEQELEEYYNQVAVDFEDKEKVSYGYVVFKPADFENVIEPDENEVELFYTENLSEFTIPEQISALIIDIKKDDGKEKADKILERAQKGEDFTKLIKEVSENKNTEAKWYKRGDLDIEVENEIFENNKAGVSKVIEGKDFYTIVNVLDYKPQTIKELKEVRDQIKAQIIKGLAPAYAKDKADKIKALIDGGQETPRDLTWQEVPLSGKGESPIEFEGLTDKILENPSEKSVVVEYGDNVLVAKVNEYKESKILPFAELKDKKEKLVNQYMDNQINKEIQDYLTQIIAELKDKSLTSVASKKGLKVENIKGFSKNGTSAGIASKPTIREAIINLNKKGDYSKSGVKFEDKYYIFQVTNVTQNNDTIDESEIVAKTDRAKEEQREVSIKNILNVLQARSDIKYGRYINLD